ncbi:MAG TPA: hypothetical protein ACFYEM_11335, partial [Candidatus Hypogeohydataceae bacterium YC40]
MANFSLRRKTSQPKGCGYWGYAWMSKKRTTETNFIKFLGTAGARFVVSTQLRASGGIWFSLDGVNIIGDPGPGCLVRCTSSRPKMNPARLNA